MKNKSLVIGVVAVVTIAGVLIFMFSGGNKAEEPMPLAEVPTAQESIYDAPDISVPEIVEEEVTEPEIEVAEEEVNEPEAEEIESEDVLAEAEDEEAPEESIVDVASGEDESANKKDVVDEKKEETAKKEESIKAEQSASSTPSVPDVGNSESQQALVNQILSGATDPNSVTHSTATNDSVFTGGTWE